MKTAVEWLVEQLDGERHLTTDEINRVVKKAVEMEREKIIKAHNHGHWEGDGLIGTDEQYYNETYKQDEANR